VPEIPRAGSAFFRFSARKRSCPVFISPVVSSLLRVLVFPLDRRFSSADVAEGRGGAVQSP
jgi:hypothetical protein